MLTTPVIRSLKQARPTAEIHYLTKPFFAPILTSNPYISKVHVLDKNLSMLATELRKYDFDYIFDLHNNLRTRHLKLLMRGRWRHFAKENLAKYRMVNWKNRHINISHVVERYGAVLEAVNVRLDDQGLDFFISPQVSEKASMLFEEFFSAYDRSNVLAIALGATYFTKRWIAQHFVETINTLGRPVLLLGGPDMEEEAQWIVERVSSYCVNVVAKYDIMLSAALMEKCEEVLTHDTGFMHIAAAFKLPLYVLWGNTVPEMGMSPFRAPHYPIQINDLDCRPCSKIGFNECPKGHFKCMAKISPKLVVKAIEEKRAS